MWIVSFFFLIVFFRIDALNWDLPKVEEPVRTPGSPKNGLTVTPLLSSSDGRQKAREAAVVRPFAGDVKSYAGYFLVNKEYLVHLYFWFFPCEKDSEKAPLILWIHGGPAESLVMGLFEENGPYRIVDGNMTLREHSWTKHYNVLYLDNPIGVGYSYSVASDGKYPNLYESAKYLYRAVLQLYQMFPEYEKNAFYVAGQSFGGKYIPVLANWIYRKNSEKNTQKINLKGVMIGGGSLYPVNQIKYAHYLYEFGVLDQQGRGDTISNEVRAKSYLDSRYVGSALDELYEINRRMRKAGYATPLDINDPHINMSCYDVIEEFVTREDIREEIHAGDVYFRDYKIVLWYLSYNKMQSVIRELSNTVQLGYRVLLYAGQYDMVTPPEQIDRVIAHLDWHGLEQFQKAKMQSWYSHGELAGYKKSHANLQQVLVRKANHMIVRSQQKWMLDLLKSFAV